MLMQAFRVAAQHNLQIRHFPPFHGGNTGSIPVGRATVAIARANARWAKAIARSHS